MSRGPRDGLPFWNQLGPLPVEQWCSNAEHERNEVDSFGESLNFIAEVVYSVKISDLRPPDLHFFSRSKRRIRSWTNFNIERHARRDAP
jgi:hypothetical protein